MSELKTKENDADVRAYLNSIPDERKREDSLKLLDLFEKVTGQPARMWGASIVGFGNYTYHYASGRSGEWMRTGFAPRKADLTIYLMGGFESKQALLAKLGKHKLGKGCLYIKRLSDVDPEVLAGLVRQGYDEAHDYHPPQPAE